MAPLCACWVRNPCWFQQQRFRCRPKENNPSVGRFSNTRLTWNSPKGISERAKGKHPEKHPENRGREFYTNLCFSNFSGTPGISRQNPGKCRQKVWFPWVSKDIPTPLHVEDPHPFTWKTPTPSRALQDPPPHPKISGPKSLGLSSFFFPD